MRVILPAALALLVLAQEPSADAVHLRFLSNYDAERFAAADSACRVGAQRFPSDARFVGCRLLLLASPYLSPDPALAWRLADSAASLRATQDQRAYTRLGSFRGRPASARVAADPRGAAVPPRLVYEWYNVFAAARDALARAPQPLAGRGRPRHSFRASPPAADPARRAAPDTAFLFSYFTRNGEDGVHLAWSRDGITWLPLNGGKPVITPGVTGRGIGWQEWNTTAALMRDPSILYGPDSTFHLVWTISWTDQAIGVAHSRDLIHWSEQAKVPVMAREPNTLNTWAPDLFYDAARREYVIVWASSIPGRFPKSDSIAEKTDRGRADHRLYYTTTKDWKKYSRARLLYDGGFSAIDGTITRVGDRYFLVMKDETFYPERRNLRVASAKHATGPYGPASPAFTDLHTEGPSILHTGGWWYVYYDEYTRGHYGAVRTRDFVTFEQFRDSLRTPRGIRHGSAFLAPGAVLRTLLARDSVP